MPVCFHLTSDFSHGLFKTAFLLKCPSRLHFQYKQLVHTHLVPDRSNLHKWGLSQVKRPEYQSLHLSTWGLMGDLLFHNVSSLCPGHFVLYHLFSYFLSVSLALLPSFSAPRPFHLSYGRRDSLYQIESVRVILLVWSLRPTLLLKDCCDRRAAEVHARPRKGALNLGHWRQTASLFLPHCALLCIQRNLASLKNL